MLELKSSAEGSIKSVDWLWDRRIPRGNMTILVGEEGFGKSTFLCWLAAQLSNGALPGGSYGRPVNTLILSAEDSIDHTINPRLEAAGADRSRVFDLPFKTVLGDFQGVVLPTDTDAVLEACERQEIGLLVVDPINAFLDSKVDSHKDAGIRSALGPIIAAAEAGKFALLVVLHINKGADKTERQAMMGSSGYRNAARSTLIFGLDPEQPDKDGPNRMLVHGDKHNLSKRQPGYKIEIVEKEVDGDDGQPVTTTYCRFGKRPGRRLKTSWAPATRRSRATPTPSERPSNSCRPNSRTGRSRRRRSRTRRRRLDIPRRPSVTLARR